jgi:hypothetical protein
MGIPQLSPKQFSGMPTRLRLWICKEAKLVGHAAISNVTEGDTITFNGAWDHMQNGSKLIRAPVDRRRKKIIP